MSDRDSSDVPDDETSLARRWMIPSFLVRNYQFGYERECHDLLFSGENRKGARESEIIEDETVVIDFRKQ